MKALFEYFQSNWDRKPWPVIDHALRIDRLEDGSFHFYIHPSNTDGVTSDFILSADSLSKRS